MILQNNSNLKLSKNSILSGKCCKFYLKKSNLLISNVFYALYKKTQTCTHKIKIYKSTNKAEKSEKYVLKNIWGSTKLHAKFQEFIPSVIFMRHNSWYVCFKPKNLNLKTFLKHLSYILNKTRLKRGLVSFLCHQNTQCDWKMQQGFLRVTDCLVFGSFFFLLRKKHFLNMYKLTHI